MKRIAINTGGGDAPGLNGVIRAATLGAINRGWEVLGIREGYAGLIDPSGDGLVSLDRDAVRGIAHIGGTILGLIIGPLVALVVIVALVGALIAAIAALLAPLVPIALLALLAWALFRLFGNQRPASI